MKKKEVFGMTRKQNTSAASDLQSSPDPKRRPRYVGVLLIACICAILLGSFGVWYVLSLRTIPATVYVNGVEIRTEDAYIHRKTFKAKSFFSYLPIHWGYARAYGFPGESANVPLLAVWQELGAEVTWINDDQAEILYKGTRFVLTLSEKTMYALNSERIDPELNTLVSVLGSAWHVCEPLDHDILLSASIMTNVFWVVDESIVTTWDKDEQAIYVVTSEAE
jgi:hypothetical protein